jgi:DNA-binding response OmpR family regulator
MEKIPVSQIGRSADFIAEYDGELSDRLVRWPLGILDPARRTVSDLHGKIVALTPIESDLLHLLATRPGLPIEVREISRLVWHHTEVSTSGTYQQALRSLRRKLARISPTVVIATVRGVGYRLEVLECEGGR